MHFENESEDRDSRKLFHFNFLERRNKSYKASLYLFRRLLIFVFVLCVCMCGGEGQLINEFCVGHLCFYLLFPVVFVFDFVPCAGHFVFLCCGGRWSLLSCR